MPSGSSRTATRSGSVFRVREDAVEANTALDMLTGVKA